MQSLVIASLSHSILASPQASAGGGSGVGTTVGDAVVAGSSSAAGSDVRTIVVAVIAAVIVFAILYPIARALGKGKEKSPAGASPDSAVAARMERLEQSVEAITLEIERISEGQRYTTKLLTERLPLAARVPQPGQSEKTLL